MKNFNLKILMGLLSFLVLIGFILFIIIWCREGIIFIAA
jgi:hypothetical protein